VDVKLVIENFGMPEQMICPCLEWIDAVGCPQVGMLLDVGHERNAEDENPMTLPGGPTAILRSIGDRLHHIHLHDFKDGSDHHPPFDGSLQWGETFRGLREIDYAGAFMFEPRPGAGYAGVLEKVGAAPERIESLLTPR